MRRHLITATAAAVVTVVFAADRSEIRFTAQRIFPESITSTRDGTIYIGSMELDAVFRALPNASFADAWIPSKAHGLQSVLGVFADEEAGTLWVCSSAGGGRGEPPATEQTAVKAFGLSDGSLKGSYPFPGGGFCNDFAVATDGTLYATDTTGARILRLKKGASALDVWASGSPLLAVADGLVVLADGAVYVNSFSQGTLARIPVDGDGSAGAIAKLDLSRPLTRPDGMRSVGPRTLLLIEGTGQLVEVTVNGNRADIRTLRDNLDEPTAVALSGGMAFVSEGRLSLRSDRTKDPGPFRLIGIPYSFPR